MRRFVPLAWKVNFILVSSLALGIGAAILYQSIKNAMLPGEAPVAVQLFADIRLSTRTFDVSLYRADGVEAFSDNNTIATVNANLGKPAFKLKVMIKKPQDSLARGEFRDYVYFPYRP